MTEQSFQSLYMRQLPSLRRFIARFIVQSHDIDDVLQETFIRTASKDIKSINSPKAYLYKAARNIALNELNKKSRSIIEYANEISLEEFSDETAFVDEQVHSKLQLEIFTNAVADLPKKCRQVFLMRKIYGLTHQEISDRLGIGKSAIEKHIASGVYKCRDYMNKQGYSVQDLHVIKAADKKKN